MGTFKLYTVEPESDNDSVFVFTALGDKLKAAVTGSLFEHDFILKSPIDYSLEVKKQQLMLVQDPLRQTLVLDESLEVRATIVAYLESWTVTYRNREKQEGDDNNARIHPPLNLEGCLKLHPVLLEAIYSGVLKLARPGLLNLADFFPSLKDSGSP